MFVTAYIRLTGPPLDVRVMVSQTVLCCGWLYVASGDLNSGPHPACLPSPDPSSKSMAASLEATVGASEVQDCELGQGDRVWVPGTETHWTSAHLATISHLFSLPSLLHYPLYPSERLPSPSQVCTYFQLCRRVRTPYSGSSACPSPPGMQKLHPWCAHVSWAFPQPTRELPGRPRGVLIYNVRSMLYCCLITNAH